jgi:hypothetical protein
MGACGDSGDQDFSLPELAGIRPIATVPSIRRMAISFRAVPLAQLGRGSQEPLFKPASEMDQSE